MEVRALDDELVQVKDTEYQAMLRDREMCQEGIAMLGKFQAWMLQEKGTDDLEAGLRLCTTAELWEWVYQCYRHLEWYAPLGVAEEATNRVLAYEAADLKAREEELMKLFHIDPWAGKEGTNEGIDTTG